MQITRLDHVNLRTEQREVMIAWYVDVLGLRNGARPDFGFPGAWLYAGDHPAIHLVGVEEEPGADMSSLKVEHFALSAMGIEGLLERAKAADARVEVRKVPSFPIVQVNMWDPDGNHIHIDFTAEEAEAAGI